VRLLRADISSAPAVSQGPFFQFAVPLTPAHVAAVIPLCKWKPYFWLSPLVIAQHVARFRVLHALARALASLRPYASRAGAFCVPSGLAVLFVYHRYLTAARLAYAAAASQKALGALWQVSIDAACGDWRGSGVLILAWGNHARLFGTCSRMR